jgi:dipeptidyl aminopeptidase/acylaminoacyl peptidase
VSPDGKRIMVKKIQEPFSYLVPYSRFPMNIEILETNGDLDHLLAQIPIQEKRPKGFDATQPGPRNHSWRADVAQQIYFVEALDGGDPKKEMEKRDAIYLLDQPFTGEPKKMFETSRRFRSIDWGSESIALINEMWWSTRNQVVTLVDPKGNNAPVEIVNRSTQDRYSDPGRPIKHYNKFGESVLYLSDGKDIFMTGTGASAQGDRPFIDKWNLPSREVERLWRSSAPHYEMPYVLLDAKKGEWLTRRESPEENPNYYIRNLNKDKLTQITFFPHPYPELKGIQKEMIQYKREDGLTLTAELYLPAGYRKEDGPLPTFIWAYPREYKSKEDASQINGSPYRFKNISFYGPIPWVTQGYAVFNNASMPIVGEGDNEPNDSFRAQLVANAKAAIDEGVRLGVTDPKRVGVGGHSYGAFMTANLLAHSDLFQAGIARSGAYNRTLTPFGFQREERTYWEAPEIYNNMSPFMHADKVKDPILLLHGEADNNSGTFPIQSERYYHALKGHGATVRYVTLPNESHGYRARESVLHMLYEMNRWLDIHVKKDNKGARP